MMKKAICLLMMMVLCVGVLAACGNKGDSGKVSTIKSLQNETVALQEEIVAMLNDAIANGVAVDAEFQNQVNDTSAEINEVSDLINGGELEKTSNDELDTTIATMNTTLSTLKTIKTNVQAAIDSAAQETEGSEEQADESEAQPDEDGGEEEGEEQEGGGEEEGEDGDNSAKIEQIYSLLNEAVAIRQEIGEMVTSAEDVGVTLSDELAGQVGPAIEALDILTESADNGAVEQMTDEELDDNIEMLTGNIEMLTEMKDAVGAELFAIEE
ncbi:MAG: hypothetical protein LBQ16_02880 [Gracilibacteraceae bacterium]|jgi:hypothetical protein|nr:hypothetical protein [Gracilibacteraceae bacterium]